METDIDKGSTLQMSSLISSHLISSRLISSHLISSHLISSHLISSRTAVWTLQRFIFGADSVGASVRRVGKELEDVCIGAREVSVDGAISLVSVMMCVSPIRATEYRCLPKS